MPAIGKKITYRAVIALAFAIRLGHVVLFRLVPETLPVVAARYRNPLPKQVVGEITRTNLFLHDRDVLLRVHPVSQIARYIVAHIVGCVIRALFVHNVIIPMASSIGRMEA
jgi:hypothetical protein